MAAFKQSLASFGITVLLCGVVTWIFWSDVEYFFQGPEPVILGTVGETEGIKVASNRFVRIGGFADPRVQFAEESGKTYRYFILLGSKILVKQQVASAATSAEPKAFKYNGEGRILRLADAPKYDILLDYFKEKLRLDLKGEGYVLIDGEKPRDVWLFFVIVCLSAALVVYAVVKNFVLSRRE